MGVSGVPSSNNDTELRLHHIYRRGEGLMSALRVRQSRSCSYRKRNYGLKGRVEMLFCNSQLSFEEASCFFLFSDGEIRPTFCRLRGLDYFKASLVRLILCTFYRSMCPFYIFFLSRVWKGPEKTCSAQSR